MGGVHRHPVAVVRQGVYVEAPAPLEAVPVEGDAAKLLILNAPHSRNALSRELVDALSSQLDAATSENCRLVAIAGGAECFSSGFDLEGVEARSHAELAARFLAIQDLLEMLERAPFLTVALVRGPAVGAGADLVAACDVRVGSPEATFRFPGLNFGLLLGTRRLMSLVGSGMALRLLLEQEKLSAAQALDAGLLTRVIGSDGFPTLLSDLASRVTNLEEGTHRALVDLSRRVEQRPSRDVLADSIGHSGLPERIQAYLDGVRAGRADTV